MRLLERLRVQREAMKAYRDSLASGEDEDVAEEQVLDTMKVKYGATADWMAIIQLIMTLLAMFRKQ